MVLHALILGWQLYVFFLAYVALMEAKRNGKLDAMPLIARLMAYSILAVALVLDIVFNLTIGSVLFLELPDCWTFTQRCEKWMKDTGVRGKMARWFCNGWLNPIQPGHCHE